MLQTLIDFDRTYTLDEFLNLDLPGEENDTVQYELIEGKLLATPKIGASSRHSRIATRLATRLDLFAGEMAGDKRSGTVYTYGPTKLGQTDPKASWVEPDVFFVLDSRVPLKVDGPIPVAPDIVVEIWSPSDSTRKIQTKIEAYLSAGVPLIWSVYMESNYVLVYRQSKLYPEYLTPAMELDGEPVLPGFIMSVSKLLD